MSLCMAGKRMVAEISEQVRPRASPGMSTRVAVVGCVVLFALGLVLGALEILNPAAINRPFRLGVLYQIILGLSAAGTALVLSRHALPIRIAPALVLAAAFGATLLLACTVTAVWPNSGDEYGYVYAARTLLAGRVFNPAPPLPDLFDFFWIGIRDGKMAGQYPPGWPVVLAPFVAAHVAFLANPVLTLVLGLLLRAGLRRIGTPPAASAGLLVLVMLSPFTLFNGGSLFNHVQSAVAVMAICWLQLRNEARASVWNKTFIGFFFSVALVTRHEVFAITAAALGLDYVLRRRWQAFQAAVPIALGGLPVTLLWLGYNAAITGSPLVTTMLWAQPESQTFGLAELTDMLRIQAGMASQLCIFSSAALILLYLAALWTRIRTRTARFYDFLFPAAVAFFVFYPHWAGHEYGPRYWYFAWPTVALTVGTALPDDASFARLARWRVHVPTLAALQLAVYVGFVLSFGVVLRLYVDARRSVYAATAPAEPAIILIPDREFTLSPWMARPLWALARDFTRNDLLFNNPVLYGRGDEARFLQLACTLHGRHVYLWQGPAELKPIACP